MAIRESVRPDGSARARTQPAPETVISTAAAKFLAVFRVVLGFEFLWAFLDKTFGFGYATPAERAWINGGSPTKEFLSRVAVGPFEDTFHAWAGARLGGLAVHARSARHRARPHPRHQAADRGRQRHRHDGADGGPPVALDKLTSAGEPSMSTNPIVDYHIIYAWP